MVYESHQVAHRYEIVRRGVLSHQKRWSADVGRGRVEYYGIGATGD